MVNPEDPVSSWTGTAGPPPTLIVTTTIDEVSPPPATCRVSMGTAIVPAGGGLWALPADSARTGWGALVVVGPAAEPPLPHAASTTAATANVATGIAGRRQARSATGSAPIPRVHRPAVIVVPSPRSAASGSVATRTGDRWFTPDLISVYRSTSWPTEGVRREGAPRSPFRSSDGAPEPSRGSRPGCNPSKLRECLFRRRPSHECCQRAWPRHPSTVTSRCLRQGGTARSVAKSLQGPALSG